MSGKQRLLDLRRDALKEIRDAELTAKSVAASNTRAHVRSATEHEVALLRISLDRLEERAAARPDARPGILYYANDGFDMDPIETYCNAIGSHDEGLRNEVLQLSTEYGGEVSKMLARVEDTLAGKMTGSPASASRGRAIRVLEASEKPADVPVLATLARSGTTGSGRRSGMLRIVASFASVRDVLGGDGAAIPLRLTLAVDLGEDEPFTSAEEVDWHPESDSWRYQVPLNWPAEARRVAVLVEEVSTGLSGAAVVEIPAAP